MTARLITIAELPNYIQSAEKLLTVTERQDLISYLAKYPKAGDLIKGTAGVRKLRWRRNKRGKSGGVRVIYYYYADWIPLYLLALFSKGEKDNLSKAEANELAELASLLVKTWKEKR